MEYEIFGKTGRRVSRLGFGGAVAGLANYLRPFDPQAPDNRRALIAAVHRAIELGVNYFDTAPGYGEGASEELLGAALEPFAPEDLFLATKVGIWKDRPVRESLEASLKRLRRDSVDLLQIHGTVYNPEHAERILRPGGFLDQMEALKEEGLVRHIGFTAEALDRPFFDIFESGRFDVLQVFWNLIAQHAYDPARQSGAIFEAEAKGMGIAAMRGTTSGVFQKWLQRVWPECPRDLTPDIIQFQFSNPLVDVVLVGMETPERVEQNVALCNDHASRIDIGELYRYFA